MEKDEESSAQLIPLHELEMHNTSISSYAFDNFISPTIPNNNASNLRFDIQMGFSHLTMLIEDKDKKTHVYQMGSFCGHLFKLPKPVTISIPLKCTKIANGKRHVLAMMEGGSVIMSWGSDHFGQLGHGASSSYISTPTLIQRLLPMFVGGNIVDIAAGTFHSAVVVSREDGEQLFSWGFNNRNQCGIKHGVCNIVAYPHPVFGLPTNSKYEKICLSKLHSVALTKTGDVYTWGSTTFGRCGYSNSAGRKKGISLPKKVIIDTISDIATGDKHVMALSHDGIVYSWGCGEDGQLGLGVTVKKIDHPHPIPKSFFDDSIIQINAAGNYSIALTKKGYVYTWGYGDSGQLGHSSNENNQNIPYLESTLLSQTSMDNIIPVAKSFDSRYNALIPTKIKCLENINFNVQNVVCGPSNLILICEKKNEKE